MMGCRTGSQDLQQQCAQQVFRRDGGAAGVRVTGVEQPAHIGKDRINQKAEATQRVIGRHARIQTDIAEHRRLGRFLATHTLCSDHLIVHFKV